MDIEQIKQILDLVREHELSEFEVEHDGLRLKIRKDASGVVTAPSPLYHAAALPPIMAPGVLPGASAPASTAPATPLGSAGPDIELAVVKSPIVGTFFRASEPGASPFVDIGSTVKKGQVLCIVEAMKLMNEIDSEYDGEVVSVYAENGQPVQYGERLFAIKTS